MGRPVQTDPAEAPISARSTSREADPVFASQPTNCCIAQMGLNGTTDLLPGLRSPFQNLSEPSRTRQCSLLESTRNKYPTDVSIPSPRSQAAAAAKPSSRPIRSPPARIVLASHRALVKNGCPQRSLRPRRSGRPRRRPRGRKQESVAPRIRIPTQGPRPQPVEIAPPEDKCNEEILWVQTGRTIRQMRKLSMARKGGMHGRFVYIYGTYGPNGFEY